jgi:hypothetical protein
LHRLLSLQRKDPVVELVEAGQEQLPSVAAMGRETVLAIPWPPAAAPSAC